MMNIAQVSEKFDITKETLRYWERLGLLPMIPRNESGYRDYGEHELDLLYSGYAQSWSIDRGAS